MISGGGTNALFGFMLFMTCVVSTVFNVLMFVWCVKCRNQCIAMADEYRRLSDKLMRKLKQADEELSEAIDAIKTTLSAADYTDEELERMISEELDGGTTGRR